MWVEVEEGAHLSRSRTKPGSYSPLTRDRDKKLGHATLRDPAPGDVPSSAHSHPAYEHAGGDSERDRAQDIIELVEMLIRLGIFVYEESPRFRAWWHARVRPRLVVARARLSSVRRSARTGTAQGSAEREKMLPILEIEGVRPALSAGGARARLAAAIRAEEITEKEMRLLRGVRFHDRDPGQLSRPEHGQGTLLQIGSVVSRAPEENDAGGAAGK